jgi:hypothetical protein
VLVNLFAHLLNLLSANLSNRTLKEGSMKGTFDDIFGIFLHAVQDHILVHA